MMHLPEFLHKADPRNWSKRSVVAACTSSARPEEVSAMQALVDEHTGKTYLTDIPTPTEMASRFVVSSINASLTIQCLVMWLEMDAKSGKRNLRDTFCYEAVHSLNDAENTEIKAQFQQRGWLIQSEYLLAKDRFKYTIQYPRSCYTPTPIPQ